MKPLRAALVADAVRDARAGRAAQPPRARVALRQPQALRRVRLAPQDAGAPCAVPCRGHAIAKARRFHARSVTDGPERAHPAEGGAQWPPNAEPQHETTAAGGLDRRDASPRRLGRSVRSSSGHDTDERSCAIVASYACMNGGLLGWLTCAAWTRSGSWSMASIRQRRSAAIAGCRAAPPRARRAFRLWEEISREPVNGFFLVHGGVSLTRQSAVTGRDPARLSYSPAPPCHCLACRH